MARYTQRYNFKKPDPEDFYEVEDFNGNMDIAEAELFALNERVNAASSSQSIEEVKLLIGNRNDTGGSITNGSVMAKLNEVLRYGAIKSVQRGFLDYKKTTYDVAGYPNHIIYISSVVPEKSILITSSQSGRRYQSDDMGFVSEFGFTGTISSATSLTFHRTKYIKDAGMYEHFFCGHWQVIEFY